MLRSAVSKALWVGRATSAVVGLAIVLALVVGLTDAAFGANGQNFILGQLNKATAKTQLNGNVSGGPALQVANNNTAKGSRALQLNIAKNKPPLAVNATAGKALNLNADKLDGKDANQLAVRTAFASGDAASPTNNLQFLAPTALVKVGAGQAVHVTSHRGFGSSASGGAHFLYLFICSRPQGSATGLTAVGTGIWDLQAPQYSILPMGLSAVISGLPAGSYEVGMCGYTFEASKWNSNVQGYTSALVVTQPR